jgi:glutamyl-tRNA reductase
MGRSKNPLGSSCLNLSRYVIFHSMGCFGCPLKVGVVGLNHKTAGLAMREAFARRASALSGEKCRFFPHPTILLSTCNRTEIYYSAEDLAEGHSDLLAFLQIHSEQCLYSYFHIDCFAHLCKVAAGLDSAILAETEIVRQIKNAYARASDWLALPSCLHYIFQKALHVAKEVRSQLCLERGAPDLYGTIYTLLEGFWGDLSKSRGLVVGYSEINRGFLSLLRRKGTGNISLATRTPMSLEGVKVYGREILKRWQTFDWIVCGSDAKEPLIFGENKRRQLIFDLSVPRNVDPEVGRGKGVVLKNISEINELVEEKRRLQGDCLEQGKRLLWERALFLSKKYTDKRAWRESRVPTCVLSI